MSYKIKVVNLEKRLDRKDNVIKIFKDIDFETYDFYNAIDGRTIDLNLEIKNLFTGNDFCNRKGVIGCALSHYNMWIELMNDDNIDFYIIFEDDITLSPFFKENYGKMMEYINNNFNNIDLLFLGYHTYHEKNTIYNLFSIENFVNELYVGGTFGYIITKKGAIKMLNYIENNGIKHGIDYLFKINKELNIFTLEPSIVLSEWVRNLNDNVDSDIQKDQSIFHLNDISDYNNYMFIPKMDQINNDYNIIRNHIDIIIKESNNLDEVAGFNTLGFLKTHIDLNELKISGYFSDKDGIYYKLDKIIKVKMISDMCNSKDLCDSWNKFSKGNYKWNNIKITDNDDNIDYYVIINKPGNDKSYKSEKTIIFQMEPYCNDENQNWGIKTWGDWANPDPNIFLEVRNNKNFYNNCIWSINNTYEELSNMKINKTNDYLSIICSPKYFDPGHIKRIDFLKYIEKNHPEFKIDIYGSSNDHLFKNYKYSLSDDDKNTGLFPYKYYFMAENNIEYNYITEKFWEPILSECLCFYYGAPNISDYIDPLAFVQIDLNNFEETFLIMKESIENDLWSKRIDIIRKEKYKILNYYNFLPTVERTITKDLWKNSLLELTNKNKIYILQSNTKGLNIKTDIFVKNMKYFGFHIDIINDINENNIIIEDIGNSLYVKKVIYNNQIKYINIKNEKIDIMKIKDILNKINIYNKIINNNEYINYLILNDNIELHSSLNNLFNHMIFLPENYDFCQLYESNNNKFKIISQYNSLYYNVKKCFYNCSYANFVSKKGVNKILNYINNLIPYDFERVIFNCHNTIKDFDFYISKNNQLFLIE